MVKYSRYFTSILLCIVAHQSFSIGDTGYRYGRDNMAIRNLASEDLNIYTNLLFLNALIDFDNSINNVTFTWSPSQNLNAPFDGEVAIFAQNYGALGWNGIAIGYHNDFNTPCTTFPNGILTGNCNTTTRPVTFGYIALNNFYFYDQGGAGPTVAEANFLVRHEIAHLFGMHHEFTNPCHNGTSIMTIAVSCPVVPTTLQPLDDQWFQNEY